MQQQIILSEELPATLDAAIEAIPHDRVFVVFDETTNRLCRPLLEGAAFLAEATPVVIPPTDSNKSLDTLSALWKALSDGGASRASLLVCVGGGMVTDLGGFAAATFKRGINYINVPTTLLSMVDAAVGGKTGINFNGLKNEIGAFWPSKTVVIDTDLLRTLDMPNLLSGYGEMIKHGLINDEQMWAELLQFDWDNPDFDHLQTMVSDSIAVKERIVEQDPRESGIRKALNFGHTIGHAFEAFALKKRKPVLHGYAVAWGMVCELYLSAADESFPIEKMRQTVSYIGKHYGRFDFTCDDYEELYSIMKHDKKNIGGIVNFTLLDNIGGIRINCNTTKEKIFEALDFYRESL